MALLPTYWDSCPECDSLNLKVFDEHEVQGVLHWTVECRDCGADWEDADE